MKHKIISEKPTGPFDHIDGFIYFSKLSNLYFPDLKRTDSARKRMKAEIKKNKALSEALDKAGYDEGSSVLTPLQQGIIIQYFGYPELKLDIGEVDIDGN